MNTRELGEREFKATIVVPMRELGAADDHDPIDIWPYVDRIPRAQLDGHEVWDRFVEAVRRGADGRYDHVLVMTKTKDVFVVVVIDRAARVVYGHHLLDLPTLYGV